MKNDTVSRASKRMEPASRPRPVAAERYLAIAAKLKQEAGVTEHSVRSDLSGRAWYSTGHISAPEGRTRKQLYIVAHECAHIVLSRTCKPVHVRELEAEQWAHEALRRHGVAVPKSMTERARRYVAFKIERAQKRGAKDIDPAAMRFAQKGAPIQKPEAVALWCREHRTTEKSFRRLLRGWCGRFIRLEEGDSALPGWIAVSMRCSAADAQAVLRWAGLYPDKSAPPTAYFPELL